MIERAPRKTYEMCYDSAFLYCLTLEYKGHKDWRLPTQEEYLTLTISYGWYEGRERSAFKWGVSPVREIYE